MTGKAGAPLTEAMFYVLMALRRGELCGTEIAAWTERCTEGRVRLGPGTLLGHFRSLLIPAVMRSISSSVFIRTICSL